MPRPVRTVSHVAWSRPFLLTILAVVSVGALARLGLLLWQHERVDAAHGTLFILLQGLRFDLVTLGMLLAVPAALTPVLSTAETTRRIWLPALKVYLACVIAAFVFMEAASPAFIAEYDVRPNYLFIEYLKYPKEVASMLASGYKLVIAAALASFGLIMWPILRGLSRQFEHVPGSNGWSAIPMGLLALVACFGAARSTLDHRAVNPSTVAFSADSLVNSLPLNSLYSTAYAVYEKRNEGDAGAYGEVAPQSVIDAVRNSMRLPANAFVNPDIPTLHHQSATRRLEQPLNLVIIVEESLGAEFVGALGGLPLTPHIDRLSADGIWFENLYATGTRSARGLEAIAAGFPPSTSQSALKLGRAQTGFFTIADFLRRQGYATHFVYGGEAQFDNMRRFFANNGVERIVDKHDFPNPVFVGSWGVADEDVFNYAHAMLAGADRSQPSFTLLFTTTNHSPWEYPAGRTTPYDARPDTVHNAVKYADHALGQFIDQARQSDYWQDTVFLIVADHNSRVYGADLVPIERFHIPGLILGGSIQPARWQRLASQIDLLPTVLSLIGVSGEHPATGLDLTRPDIDDIPGRAVMQYGNTQAYREDDRVVILRPQKPAVVYRYEQGQLTPDNPDPALAARAVAIAAWPMQAYTDLQFRLPPGSPGTSAPPAHGVALAH